MHGLISRSLENFIRRTYGQELWSAVMEELDCGFDSFEPMFSYADSLTHQVIDLTAARLEKPREILLEDFGTFLVTDPSSERVRRLLRFGGVDYEDFLHSLDDLPGRARLAVAHLDLPELELTEFGGGDFALSIRSDQAGFGHVLLGALRALADDYGALALLEHLGGTQQEETISIRLLDIEFQKARDFELAMGAAE